MIRFLRQNAAPTVYIWVQEDLHRFGIGAARDAMGKGKIIGISTHSMAEFNEANDADVDYIAYGPVFPTKAKNYCIGTEGITDVLRIARKPVVLIGGIDTSNMPELLRLGAKNIAVMRSILQADDSEAAACGLKRMIVGNGLKRKFSVFITTARRRAMLG